MMRLFPNEFISYEVRFDSVYKHSYTKRYNVDSFSAFQFYEATCTCVIVVFYHLIV